jgi:hypothetical protein
MPTPITIKADEKRPESLQKNLYKIDSPYDLTDDVVTRSLNLLQNITGYDYRNNSVVDIVERLIDSQNSELVKIGGERLLVEFGRRAANNVLDKFIPSPTNLVGDLKNIIKGNFKKTDASITDITKNPKRTFFDKILQTTIGYRDNENFLDSEYSKNFIFTKNSSLKLSETSDVNYKFSGDMIKEKIQQLNKKSVFSTYNITNSKIDFNNQSLIFRNTYKEDFISNTNNSIYYNNEINTVTETYTKSYFQPYENPNSNSLIKNYDLEKKNIEENNGFGFLDKMNGFRTDRTGDVSTVLNRLSVDNIDRYVYDSNDNKQKDVNEKFGVRRGLVYFTSKLAQENPIIAHNRKIIKTDSSVNPPIVYYKGNGECRTFTLYDQYDNYGRVIKFNGNNEKNSVLRDRVLPRIAPTVDDGNEDKYNYFFTMENLALQDDVLECEKGPNGGRWMWFAPYDVKISDNNSVNWSDLNFLGRPEPIFSYQNTVRNLSLSFRLLIDTVKEIQDVEPTIQNYYNYLYNCVNPTYKTVNEKRNVTVTSETPTSSTTKTKFRRDDKAKYHFKNDGYVIDVTNPDYTSGDTGFSGITTINNGFISELDEIVGFLKQYILDPQCTKIEMSFEGFATRLITQTLSQNDARIYNRALGMRRADNLMRNVIYKYNQVRGDAPEIKTSEFSPLMTDSTTVGGQVVNSFYIKEGTVDVNENRTYYQLLINNKNINIKITTTGADSDPKPVDNDPNQTGINDINRISQRYAKLDAIIATVEVIQENTKIDTTTEEKELPIPLDEVTQKPQPCDEDKNLQFKNVEVYNKFPTGFEKLNVFTPSFNSQTPFDFTKRYVFLHQLTRPSKIINKNLTKIDNTVFGRMPVFVLRYGDFIYSKAIARSINFDIQESTWDLNPEGMGVIPLMCNVTMDLTLLGGQSLAGPIDRIQTANDSNFIANSTFNSGYYAGNKTFEKARDQEKKQWEKISNADNKPNPKRTPSGGNKPQDDSLIGNQTVEQRGSATPVKNAPSNTNKTQDIPPKIDKDGPVRESIIEKINKQTEIFF